MINFLALLLALGAVIFLWVKWFIPREVENDYEAIIADGSKDSLKGKFHALRALKRGVVAALLSAGFFFFYPWLPLGVFTLLMTIFWIRFDVKINRRRGLPDNYIGKNAFIDKLFGKYPDKMKNVKGFFLILSIFFIVICLLDYLDTNNILRIFG